MFGLIHGRIGPFQDGSLARFLMIEQSDTNTRRALISHYGIELTDMSDVEDVWLRQGNP